MNTAAVFVLIIASGLAIPIEDLQDGHGLKKFRESPVGYYGLPGYAAAGGIAAASAAGSGHGEVVGVFPHAKASGCSVPLLLSCSPNVISGKLLSGYSAPAYKKVEEDLMRQAEWMDQMREANRHIHNPEPNLPGVVSLPHLHKNVQANKKLN